MSPETHRAPSKSCSAGKRAMPPKQRLARKKAGTKKRPVSNTATALTLIPQEAAHPRFTFNSDARGGHAVRIGSDCSGWCTEFHAALATCALPVVHVFASDINKSVRNFIMRFVMPLSLYNDIKIRVVPGNLDCYVSGFPCKPFSVAGRMRGVLDERGTIVEHVLLYVQTKLPKSFLLENVTGMVSGFTTTFAAIVDTLRAMVTANGNLAYEVFWRTLNTSLQGGLPQNRPRVYVIGILRSEMRAAFTWPQPAPLRSLEEVPA